MVHSFRIYLLLLAFTLCTPSLRADSPDGSKHKPNTKLWKTEKEQGETAFKNHQLVEAETHFQAALAEAENFDARDYRLAESLAELGEFYARTGKFTEAEPLLQRAAVIRRGDPNPLIEANVEFLLGFTCEQLRHYDTAEKAFLRAQELYSRKLGPDHPLAVRCTFYLGAIYDDQQDYAKAEPLLKRSLALFQHPATRNISHKYGDPAAGPGVEIWMMKFRPDFVYAMETLVRLGSLYAKLNRTADSESNLKDALTLIDDRLTSDPATAVALRQIAAVFLARTNYAAAEPFMQRSAAFNEKTKGPDDDATLAAQAELALIYEREGKLPEAEAVYKKIIAAREKKSGPDGDASASAAEPLIQLYFRQERYQDAEPLVAHQLAGLEKNQGDGLAMLPVLSEQALIYAKLNRDADLEGVYKRQLAVFEKMFGPKNKALIKPLNDYAALLRKLKRDAEASVLESRALEIQADALK